jgi:hypothetical protein
VVCGRLDAAQVASTLHRARTAAPVVVAALHVSPLPPLARQVLVTTAQVLSGRLGLGRLVAALPLLEERMLTVALLRRLGRLEDPTPAVGLHALSWLPGALFVVRAGRPGWVRKYGPRAIEELAPPIEDPASRVLAVCGRSGSMSRSVDALVAALPSASVQEFAASPESTRWWGSADAAELCVAPLDPAATIEAALVTCAPCPWCEQPAPPGRCPTCGYLSAPGPPVAGQAAGAGASP